MRHGGQERWFRFVELLFFAVLATLFTSLTILLLRFGGLDDLEHGWHTYWVFLGVTGLLWYEVFGSLRYLLQVARTNMKWLLAGAVLELFLAGLLSYCAVMLAVKGKYAGISLHSSVFMFGGLYFCWLFLKSLRALTGS